MAGSIAITSATEPTRNFGMAVSTEGRAILARLRNPSSVPSHRPTYRLRVRPPCSFQREPKFALRLAGIVPEWQAFPTLTRALSQRRPQPLFQFRRNALQHIADEFCCPAKCLISITPEREEAVQQELLLPYIDDLNAALLDERTHFVNTSVNQEPRIGLQRSRDKVLCAKAIG
jgi:hypothetical protein